MDKISSSPLSGVSIVLYDPASAIGKTIMEVVATDITKPADHDGIFSESFDPISDNTSYTYQQGFVPKFCRV